MKKYIYIFFYLALYACKKEDKEEVQYAQPNPAQHNNYILESRVSGDKGALTYFFGATSSGDGNSYYLSYNHNNNTTIDVIVGGNGQPTSGSVVSDENYEVGKITPSGIKLWAKNNPFPVRYLLLTDWLTGQLQNGVIGVGYRKLSQSQISNGGIVLYDKYGNLITSTTTLSGGVWLNSLSKIPGTNNVLAFGGQAVNGISYPFVCTISVDNNGLLNISGETTIQSLPNCWFVTGKYVNKNGIKYIASISQENFEELGAFGYNNDNIWKNRVSLPNMNSSFYLGDNTLIDNDKIYIGCAADDIKEPAPQNGYWTSGLIKCYSLSGTQLWETKISLSNKGDGVRNVFIKDNYIWAAGMHSRLLWTDDPQKRGFGNGLLSKLDKNNGQIINNYTFSNSNGVFDNSFFRCMTLNNNFLNIFGCTNFHYESNQGNEWVIKLDINRL